MKDAAVEIIHNIQNHYFAIIEKQDELDVLGIRTATVMVFAVLRKIAEGKRPCSFDSDDWKDITVSISKNAILELELRMGSKPLSKTKATYLRRLGSSIVCAIAAQNRGELRSFPRVRIFDAVYKKRNRKSAGHKPVALVDFSEQLFYNILIK